jgi:hypothetical protein
VLGEGVQQCLLQNFVFRPVPGAGGVARRLRSRSFRVNAYTELVCRWCLRQLNFPQARIFYSAGGTFLIWTAPFENWRTWVEDIQAQIDSWAWQRFQGELIFTLAAVEFASAKIPYQQRRLALENKRAQPLAAVLRPSSWATPEFFRGATISDARCSACGMTRPVKAIFDGEEVCDLCRSDEEIGRKLSHANFVRLVPGKTADLVMLDLGMEIHDRMKGSGESEWLTLEDRVSGAEPWLVLRHVPRSGDKTLDFEEIARMSVGTRKWLGYMGGNNLTFSAGVSLAKPREHILSQARHAAEELDRAKRSPGYGRELGRDQVRALGVTMDWSTFGRLLTSAKQVTRWLESNELPVKFIHQILQLHHSWRQARSRTGGTETAASVKYRPLLYYQVRRNLRRGQARDWADSLLHDRTEWPWADFIVRYAMLAARNGLAAMEV